jgi:hypothetical protein
VARSGDGWREPRLRLLRTVAFLVLCSLLVVTVFDDAVATSGLLVGALMVLLGFEGVIRWPPGGGSSS